MSVSKVKPKVAKSHDIKHKFVRTTSYEGKNFGPFAGATFMGLNFRPDEVVSAIQKELRRNNAEGAYLWIINMMASGSIERAWGRLLVIASEDISIGNPYLSAELWKMYSRYKEIRKEKEKLYKQSVVLKNILQRPIFELRNNLEIRTLLCKATLLVSNSYKIRIADHIPKVYFKSRERNDWNIWAGMQEYPIYKNFSEDPIILLDRLKDLLQNGLIAVQNGENPIELEKEAFDIAGYLFQLGTINKKTKHKFLCKNKKNKQVSCTNVIWDDILSVSQSHSNQYFRNEIQALYNIFKVRENSSDDKKLPFIHAILLFFRNIDWNKAVEAINRELRDGSLTKLCEKLNDSIIKGVLDGSHGLTSVPEYALDKHTKRGKRGKDNLSLTKQFLYDELAGLEPKLNLKDIYQEKAFELEIKRKNIELNIPPDLDIPPGLEETVIQLMKIGKKDKSHLIKCIQEAGLFTKELYGIPIKVITEEQRNDIQKLPHAQLKAGKHKRVVYVNDEVVIKGPYKISDDSFITNLIYTEVAGLVEKKLFGEDSHYSILPWSVILNYGGEYYLVAPNVGKPLNKDDIEIRSSTMEKDQKIIKRGAFINRILDVNANKLTKEQIKAILKHLYIRYILGIGDSGLHNILIREDTKKSGKLIVGNDLEEKRGPIKDPTKHLNLLFRGSGPRKEFKDLFDDNKLIQNILKRKNNKSKILEIAGLSDAINVDEIIKRIETFEECKK